MRAYHVANERLVPARLDAHQHNRKVAGNSVKPQSRSAQRFFPECGCVPIRRINKHDASGQSVEQRNLLRGQVRILKLVAIAFRSVGKCLVGRVEARISLGDRLRHRFVVSRARHKSDAFHRSRLEMNCGSQAEDRIENGTSRPRETCCSLECHRVRGRAASAEELEPIGLVLDQLTILRARSGNMNCPDRLFFSTARSASCKQGTGPVIKLRFHKKLGKGRMCLVRAAVVQADFGIAGQFEVSRGGAMIGDLEHPHFRIDIGCDAGCPGHFDVLGETAEFGTVSEKGVLVDIVRLKNGLFADGPKLVVRPVFDVTELPPAIARRILTPARNVQLSPRPITGPGGGEQDVVATIGKQGHGRARSLSVRRARILRGIMRAIIVDRTHHHALFFRGALAPNRGDCLQPSLASLADMKIGPRDVPSDCCSVPS